MKKNFFIERFDQLVNKVDSAIVDKIHNVFYLQNYRPEKVDTYKVAFVKDIFNEAIQTNDDETILACKKILLIGFILTNWNELNIPKGGAALKGEYENYLKRIYDLSHAKKESPLDVMDVFWKELAIARLHMFPVYSSVVEFYSGFGLRQGLSGNLFQSTEFLLFSFKYGRKPYYRTHLHTPLLDFFSAEGWIKSYLQIAEMLKRDESIRGLARTSWYFDPKIKMISPHLSYLQELPLKNGAHLFCVGADNSGSALEKSKSRLTLYNKGDYAPMNYLLVWPRDALITWAEKHNRSRE